MKGENVKTAYLDIETNYVGTLADQRLFRDCKNHKITVIGVRIVEGEKDAFVQLVGEEATREALMAVLEGVERIVTYNGRSIPDNVKGYTGFDFPVIAAQLGVVLDKTFKHLDLCPACWKAGLWGGQKAIEEMLGLKRELAGKDGKWADETWKKYVATRTERFLKELLTYNREDVFMLRRIEEALERRSQKSGAGSQK
ncbi:MAG: ribonuclease H-like domain-containing protein [Terriglobia bacterium]